MGRRVSGVALGVASANVLALGALVAATGGTAWAAKLIGAADIADGAVMTSKLADRAVTSTKLGDSAVSAAKLANNAVSSAKLANNAVTSSKIAVGAVGSTRIAANAVTSTKIATGAVGQRAIAKGSVLGTAIANGAVDTKQIRDRGIRSYDLADKSIGRRHLAPSLLKVRWPNAHRLDGIDSTGFVRLHVHAGVWAERHADIPIPRVAEASIARIDSTDIKGSMMLVLKMTIASQSTNDDTGTVRCRAVYGTGSSATAIVGFRYTQSNGIQVGGNELVISDFHAFRIGPRNTIDIRCQSSTDNVVARDISFLTIRLSKVTSPVVT